MSSSDSRTSGGVPFISRRRDLKSTSERVCMVGPGSGRCGARRPETMMPSGVRRARRRSSLAVSNASTAPMLWPQSRNGRSRCGPIAPAIDSTIAPTEGIGGSVRRLSRPGNCTETTSTMEDIDSGHSRNVMVPPPANGKQNRRTAARGLARGVTNQAPSLVFIMSHSSGDERRSPPGPARRRSPAHRRASHRPMPAVPRDYAPDRRYGRRSG